MGFKEQVEYTSFPVYSRFVVGTKTHTHRNANQEETFTANQYLGKL